MKKAKQFLSLMLVVVMVLGMMVFVPGTASAKSVNDYPDADSIEYKEAVDVLTALQVFEGDDSGTFGPKSNFTREQAAKIIAYILIGKTAADRLSPRASSFTDVEDSRWSVKYIEYCVEKGIIKGYGDGRFGPADPVTAVQMAKMLLVCVGYGAVGEYDNPDSWQLNTIVDGQKREILTLDKDYTQPASREEVAQYTFNALVNPDLVTYSELAKQYLNAGSNIFNTEDATNLGVETFDLAKQLVPGKFGHGQHYWYQSKVTNRITEDYNSDNILGSLVSGALSTTGSFFTSYAWGENSQAPIEVWVNGESYTYKVSDFAVRGGVAYPFPAGSYVEFIDIDWDGVVDKIIVTYELLAQVTKVTPATGTINVLVYETADGSNKFGTTSIFAEGVAVDDFVLIAPQNAALAGGTITLTPVYNVSPLRVTKAEAHEDELTAFTGDPAVSTYGPTLTFGGQTYSISAKIGMASSSPTFGSAVYYLDSYGSVIGFDATSATAATRQYIYVNNAKISAAAAFEGATAKISVIHTDGKIEVLDLATNSAGSIAYGPGTLQYNILNGNATDLSNAAAALTGNWYSYTLNANGQVRLTSLVSSAYVGTLGYAQGLLSGQYIETDRAGAANISVAGTTARATSSTTLSLVKDGTRRNYTGFSSFPELKAAELTVASGGAQILVVYAPGGAIASIYVINGGVTTIPTYGINLGKLSTQSDGAHYSVLVGGEVRTIVSDNENFAGGAILTVDEDDELALAGTTSTMKLVSGPVIAADSGYVSLYNTATKATEFYYFDDSCQFASDEYGWFMSFLVVTGDAAKITATTLRDYTVTASLVADADNTVYAVAYTLAAKSGSDDSAGKIIVSYDGFSASTATGVVGGTLAEALADIKINVTYHDNTTGTVPLSTSGFLMGDIARLGGDPTPPQIFTAPGTMQVFAWNTSYAIVGEWVGTAWAPGSTITELITVTINPAS